MLIEPAEIKILLAEDAKTMRRIEVESLKKLGFTNIIEANDGAEAMELLKKETVDLIISDWNMPNKSGYDLLEWVRADENFKDVPFIMATAQSDKNYLKQAEEAGVTGFIPKPFSNDELKKTIDRVFGEEAETEEIIDNKIDGKVKLKIAHIQITDHLVLGVLKDMIDKGDLTPKYFDLETVRMSGWNSVLSDLEDGKVDAACVLAPIAMDLYSANVPIKLILLAHKSGSVLVRNKLNSDFEDSEVNFFRNKSFIIPHKMSVHHMLTDIFFKGIGLNPNLDKGDEYDIELEVAAPVNMPKFLKNNQLNSGFMVAEPIGANAISKDIADLQFYTNELWENHPCCVIAARDEFLEMETDAAYELTEMLVKAGKLIKSDPDRASEIALSFLDPEKKLGLKTEIIKKVITDPNGIKTDDLFPVIDDLEEIMHYMHNEMEIGSIIDLEEFVDLRFAYRACDDDRTISKLIKSPEELNYLLTKKELPAEEEDLITSFTPSPEDLETLNEDQTQDSELFIPLDTFEEEEVVQEEVAQEEVAQEEVAQEEVVQEEVVQEEVAQEEVAQEEVAQEEVAQEEVVQEEVVQEEVVQEEVVQEEVVQEEVAQEEVAQEEVAQ
ncbi:MAG: response regulator, partial [Desulfobacterales bacterium]|nr:response regulator [Desulfobacterales bacterium]